MLIGSRQRLSQIISDPILSIESESIKRVSSTKTLGVVANDASSGKTILMKWQRKLQRE